MFAQVFPAFQENSVFVTHSVLNYNTNVIVSVIALIANVLALGYIIYRSKMQDINPYTHDVFRGTRDFEQAVARIAPGEME